MSLLRAGLSASLRGQGWTRRLALTGLKDLIGLIGLKGLIGLGAVLLVCALLAPSKVAAQPLPSFDALRASHRPSDVPVLDRHGVPVHSLRINHQVRRGPWVALEDISPALRLAIVLGEDRRFWDHGGVDWPALAAAAWANAWNTRTRGASTLTMQLAGLLDEELARPAGGRSVGAKLGQMARARQLEARWSKVQLLEAYLNRVPLRGELEGVAAAAQVLFGKHPSGLDAVESALLAAMVRGPNVSAPVLQRRACELLRLQDRGCEAVAITASQALARRPGPLGGEMLAPHLAQQLLRGIDPAAPPAALHSTLDARLQRAATAALRRQLAELRGRNVEDGAVLVLDNASGEVRAWVGSSGPGSSAPAVDAVLARRQPGSTLKPLVYGLALQQRLLTPATLLDDAPLQLATGGALYQPQNYDGGYKGPVSVRQALAASLNIPAVRVGAMLGPDALFAKLNEAGLALSHHAGHHGQALALGGAEVTLLALSNAYRMLARGGLLEAVHVVPGAGAGAVKAKALQSRQVFEPAVAWQVADMLADPAARAITFGLDSPLVTRGWAAVKTGTSKDMRDNWCIGFSSRWTVGVWVGNASGAPMHGVSGVSGAAPVWRELMLLLHEGQPAPPLPRPPGLVAQDGHWLLAGTDRGVLPAAPVSGRATGPQQAAFGAFGTFGIAQPTSGSVILLDPDIPMAAQRLLLAGAPGQWRINGRVLGQGARLHWLPRPGRHVLERVDAAPGSVPDRVVFEVRAAPPPRQQRQPPPKRPPTRSPTG